MELTYDKMYTVTSRLKFTVSKEDDGVPVACIVDHPAVKDFQAQKYLEVQCKYFWSVITTKICMDMLSYNMLERVFQVSNQLGLKIWRIGLHTN